MDRLIVLLCSLLLVCSLTSCFYAARETGVDEMISVKLQTEPVQTTVTKIPTETVQATELPEHADDTFVKVTDYISDLTVDLRYATTENFTGQVIYEFTQVYLRYGTVRKLMLVQRELLEHGLSLKIWDGFRPPSAQFKLWEVCPDPTYVSDPNNGFSSHSRGNTVDITLTDSEGNELTMPTGFDDFSLLADRDYSDCSDEAASNARYLEELMEKYGFKGYYGEWWHFTDTDSYEIELNFVPQSRPPAEPVACTGPIRA